MTHDTILVNQYLSKRLVDFGVARCKEQEKKGARSKNKKQKKKNLGNLLQAMVMWT